jgi:alanyl-tRNA synthetase
VKRDSDDLTEIASLLKVQPQEAVSKARKLVETLRAREREVEQLKARLAGGGARDSSAGAGRTVAGVSLVVRRIDGLEIKDLRAAADRVREQIKSGVVVLGSVADGKVNLIAAVTPDLAKRVHAGNLVRAVADLVGGSGGGNATMGQAGGRDPGALDAALARVDELVEDAAKKAL